MTGPSSPRPRRRTGWAIVAVLAAVIALVAIAAVITTASTPKGVNAGATPSRSSSTTSPGPIATRGSTPSVTAVAPPTASSPQPTRTASMASQAPIVKKLAAKVTKIESVQGKANGPGEIAGPAVRFTITISNATGQPVNLTNTVVNAYFGPGSTPAVEIEQPGGTPFPASVASGASVTGRFVFTIAKADRGKVVVTLDTSVKNPVVAFRGSVTR